MGKPWLLEVNSSPALTLDCKIDEQVKTKLIKDTINLIGDNFDTPIEKVKSGKPRPFFKTRTIKKSESSTNDTQIDPK